MHKHGRTYWIIMAVFIILIAGGVDRSLATPLNIENWDFEAVTGLEDGKGSFMNIPSWIITGQAGTWNPRPTSYIPTDEDYSGGNIAWINTGYISQLLTDDGGIPYNLTAGHLYTLTVDVGNRFPTDFPGYSIELWAGGTLFASADSPIPADGYFTTATASRLATDNGGQLEIRLTTAGIQTNFDNVSLTNQIQTAVPEPATLLLLGSGLLGVAWFSRKKFKA